jgi:lipoic acid synthetase
VQAELTKKPIWLRISPPGGEIYTKVKASLRSRELHTVCEEARCPNLSECWGSGTATIMIMGDICTRGCRFCAVNGGKPVSLDSNEPVRVAEAIKEWGLKYVVITSVCRDDLKDGGASHMASTIRAIKSRCPMTIVEVLIPDFKGDIDSLRMIIQSGPKVISHNIETIRRLTSRVRDLRASYEQSLSLLKKCKQFNCEIYTKSSIMIGLGESEDETIEAMRDLRAVGVDILTMGQYLQPTARHFPVCEYIQPVQFEKLRGIAETMGFIYVASGPLVRSSYRAGDFFAQKIIPKPASV